MPDTTRFSLPYPSGSDAPNGPLALQGLAEQVETWLARAIPCLSTDRPGSPPDGMLIRETDTGLWLGYNASASAWEPIAAGVDGGTGGGGGSAALGAAGEARYAASSVQSIREERDTEVAFGKVVSSSDYVTRSTWGAGHRFRVGLTGRWAIDATVRYDYSERDGGCMAALYSSASPNAPLQMSETCGFESVATPSLSVIRRLNANTDLWVITRQRTSRSRDLAPLTTGAGVQINFTYLGA